MTKEQVKQPEQPVYKKPLFWTTILFGALSFFLVIMVFVVDSHYVELTNALAKHNLYYSSKDKDIYTKISSSEQTTSSSSSSSTSTASTKNGEKFKVDISDEYAWMKAFTAIKKGETISWSDMLVVKTQYTFALDKMLQLSDNPTEEQKKAVENGKDIMDQTVNFYKNAEHYDRELSKEEKSIILSNITEMMKVVYLFTKEH